MLRRNRDGIRVSVIIRHNLVKREKSTASFINCLISEYSGERAKSTGKNGGNVVFVFIKIIS